MRTLLRVLFLVTLSTSLAVGVPVRATAAMALQNSGCCAKMDGSNAERACEKHAPKSAPDRQCCAACAHPFPLFVSSTTLFAPLAGDEQSFAIYGAGLEARAEQPPVPPPRFAAA